LTQITQNAAGTTSTKITVPNTVSDMGYDGNGNLKKIIIEKKVGGVVKSTITTVRTYDALNRVISKTETTVEGSITYSPGTITYQYDIVNGTNELKELDTYPGSITVQKIFDVAGRLRAVINDSQQTDYTYDDNGRRSSIIYNSKFKQSYSYYDDGQLNQLVNAINVSGTYVDSEKYKYYYDNADNISRKDETVSGTLKTTNYTYDNMNRLWTVLETLSEGTKTTTYTYDSRGNRDTTTISITGTSPSTTYTKYDYRANNSLRAETIRNGGSTGTIKQVKEYKYDGNGNLLSIYDAYQRKYISVNTYTYLNELDTSMVGTNTIFNTYNAEGQRVKKTLNAGAPERYFYEGDKVVFQYANSNSITAFNVIGTNLISRKIGTTKVYYFYNGHGDVTALLDASTSKTRARYAYDAFGNIRFEKYYDSNGNLTTTPANMVKSQVRFGEYQYDSETEYKDANNNDVTGLYYLNARHYDPGMARFLEVDTYNGELNDPLSLNLYTYCHNEPLMYSDPSGHHSENILCRNPFQTAPNADVYELQADLKILGCFDKGVTNYYTGIFDDDTEFAVNVYKDKVMKLGLGNQGDNRGKVGATTWAYIDRDVDLKGIEYLKGKSGYSERYNKIIKTFNTKLGALMKPKRTDWSRSGNTIHYGKQTIMQAYKKSPTKKVLSEPERNKYARQGMIDKVTAQKEAVKAVVDNPVGALKDYYTDPETYLEIGLFPYYGSVKRSLGVINGISSRINILSSGDVNAIYYQLGSDAIIVEEQGIMMIAGAGLSKGLKLPSKGTSVKGTGGANALFRKTANTGVFKELSEPMQLRHVEKVAKEAGIGLDGIKIRIDRNTELLGKGYTGWADPKGKRIDLYPDAFVSKEELIKTLAHERMHIYQAKTFGPAISDAALQEYEAGSRIAEITWMDFLKMGGK